MRRVVQVLFLSLLTLVASPLRATAQYNVRVWTTEDGLPQASIIGLAQTPDGFIWMTTLGGLARFDGRSFRTYDTTTNPELPNSRFGGILVDDEGTLWITLQTRELLRFAAGRFEIMGPSEGLPSRAIVRLSLHRGKVVVDTTSGTWLWRGGRFEQDPAVQPPPEASSLVLAGLIRGGGRWYRDKGGRAYRFEVGTPVRTLELPGGAIVEDGIGGVWSLLPAGAITTVRDGRLVTFGQAAGQLGAEVLQAVADRDRAVWFLGSRGISRFHDGRFISLTVADGLPDAPARSLLIDREGSLWVGTNSGLARVQRRPIAVVTEQQGLEADNTYPVLQDRQGTMWIGGWSGLTQVHGSEVTSVSARYGLTGRNVLSLMEDADGSIWVGTLGAGLLRIVGERAEVIDGSLSLAMAHVMRRARDGTLWIGTGAGLMRYRNRRFEPVRRRDGSTGEETSALFEDASGTLWVGNIDGLARVAGDVLVQVGTREGFTGTRVRAMYQDGSGTLWFGTYDTGLFRYRDGRFQRFTVSNGLPTNGAFHVIEDDEGQFWVSSNVGIYRVSRASLDAVAAGRERMVSAVLYGRDDGMVSQECNGLGQPAGVRAADGRLWFPTQRGVAIVDPLSMRPNLTPPPVTLLDVNIGGFPTAERTHVQIRSGSSEFQARFAALTFVRPELARFRYRMEGLDPDWVEAGTERTARYASLPYGSYRFRVLAANRDGIWNEEGVALQVTVVAPFYRTRWFAAMCVCLLVAAVGGSYRWRLSLLERRQRVQEAFARQLLESQEQERLRIAAGLHDGLQQNLIVLKNWALLGQRDREDADPVRVRFGEIAETAGRAISDVRDVVHDLVPYQLERLGLSESLREMAERACSPAGLALTCELDDVPDLSSTVQINAFRIVQECVTNVVKHAGATRVWLRLHREGRNVVAVVQDDGRGGVVVDAHGGGRSFGVLGMMERARLLGGSVEIESPVGAGTVVRIVVPMTPAGQAS